MIGHYIQKSTNNIQYLKYKTRFCCVPYVLDGDNKCEYMVSLRVSCDSFPSSQCCTLVYVVAVSVTDKTVYELLFKYCHSALLSHKHVFMSSYA